MKGFLFLFPFEHQLEIDCENDTKINPVIASASDTSGIGKRNNARDLEIHEEIHVT